MSRFIDKLKRVSQAGSPPMGFGARHSISKPRLLLVANLSQAGIDNPAELVAGADAGLLRIEDSGLGSILLKKIAKVVPDIPWGGWLNSISRGEVKQIMEAGYDFLVFPPEISLEVLGDEKVGRVLVVDASLERDLVKVLDELPVDAVLINSQQAEYYPITWHHLMLFKRFATLSGKPLLVSVPSDITTDALQLLWETGVDGLVIEVIPEQPAGGLKRLRQAIDSLTLPSKRKRMRTRAIVPTLKAEATPITDEEEEE